MEEGKDVLAWDDTGRATAFQLKAGDIGKTEWRAIRDEIIELVEHPIRHPSFNDVRRHRSILVTTGNIHESVFPLVRDLNIQWQRRRLGKLETWCGSELLVRYRQKTGSVLPQQLPDFHRLLGLMIANGDAPLDKSEFSLLLDSVFQSADAMQAMAAKLRPITAAPIIGEYAMATADRQHNYFAKLEGYVLLGCQLLGAAARLQLTPSHIRPTMAILEVAIERCVESLYEEAAKERTIRGLADPFLQPFSDALVCGALAAHWISCKARSNPARQGAERDTLPLMIHRLHEGTRIASEAFVPSLSMAAMVLRQSGYQREGDSLLTRLLWESVLRKAHKELPGLFDPYVPVEDAVLHMLGKGSNATVDRDDRVHTYTTWPLVLLVARRLDKTLLQTLWHDITSLCFVEFSPDEDHGHVAWSNLNGCLEERMAPRPAKWIDIRSEATRKGRYPRVFNGFPQWVPYFALVYPHRFSSAIAISLDEMCAPIS